MKSILLMFEESEDGFIVHDSARRSHRVTTPDELWALLQTLTADPKLPASKIAASNDTVGIGAGLLRRLLPRHTDLVDAAEPAAHSLAALGPVINRLRTTKQ